MIPKPNYTQIPNIFFDSLLAELNDSELRVFLVIMRKTFGWNKERDRISLSQIETMTGLSRQAVINGLYGKVNTKTKEKESVGLVEMNLVTVFETKLGNEYLVNVVDQHDSEVVNLVDQTSQPSGPEVVNVVDTQKKLSKETIQKKKNASSMPKVIDPLYHPIEQSFLSQGRFTNYKKEGALINVIIKGIRNLDPDDPEGAARKILETFRTLTAGNERFWREQPFTPSGLSPNLARVWAIVQKSEPRQEDWFENLQGGGSVSEPIPFR